MARLKSPEKREALLQAAAREIATEGLRASTAGIAKGAGVAEGTMFTYFASKEELFNELYIDLKAQSHLRICAEFPQNQALLVRVRHIWIEYARWALEKPSERNVSVLATLHAIATPETRERVRSEGASLEQTLDEMDHLGAFRSLPKGFACSALTAMLGAVIDTAARSSRGRMRLIEGSFEAFWRMTV